MPYRLSIAICTNLYELNINITILVTDCAKSTLQHFILIKCQFIMKPYAPLNINLYYLNILIYYSVITVLHNNILLCNMYNIENNIKMFAGDNSTYNTSFHCFLLSLPSID